MTSSRPRRHSVVTLRLTVTADDEFSDVGSSNLPTRTRLFNRSRPLHNSRPPTSPQHRAPPSPQHRTAPSSPLHRANPPTSPYRNPTSPLRRTPTSPLPPASPFPSQTPFSPRQFRYDSSITHELAEQGKYDQGTSTSPSEKAPTGCYNPPGGLARRSSLLTVPGGLGGHDSFPSDQFLRPPRPRSSSLAGPPQTPDLLQ